VELVVFIGVQGAGKSTFYRERFFDTHVRISLDQLRTRHRERSLVEACLALKQPFVVDNTNPTAADRARYVLPARQAGFRVVGYYFQSRVVDALARNARREGLRRVPDSAVLGTFTRLELPQWSEGFDALYDVRVGVGTAFTIEEWKREG
jgi:predicted kinase